MKTQQTTISEVSLICKSKVKASDRPQIKCSKDVYNLFMEHWNYDTIEHIEVFKVMLNQPCYDDTEGIISDADPGLLCRLYPCRFRFTRVYLKLLALI